MNESTVQMLGGLRVCAGSGQTVELPPDLPGVLLAFLALNIKRRPNREELLEALWPDEDPEATRPRLRQCLYLLRQILEDCGADSVALVSNRSTIYLDPDLVRTDVADMEELLASATREKDLHARAARLTEACSNYHGPLLPGFYQDFAATERDRLEQVYRTALLARSRACEQIDDYDCAVDAAQKAINLDPLSEEANCDLMRLYARMGRPGAALAQYRTLERVLEAELGAKPSASARALAETMEGQSAIEPDQKCRPTAFTSESHRRAKAPRRPRLRLTPAMGIAFAVLVALPLGVRTLGRKKTTASAISAAAATLTFPAAKELLHWRYPNNPGDKDSEPTGIAIGENGVTYVTGFVGTVKSDVDYLTIAIKGDRWVEQRFNGLKSDVDRARSIALDKEGNVYVTGDAVMGEGKGKGHIPGLDIVTIKYDKDLNPSPTWPNEGCGIGVRRYNGKADGEDLAKKIHVDRENNVYVLGSSWSKNGHDIVVIKYGPTGKQLWAEPYGDPDLDDEARDMVVQPNGDVYVAGTVRRKSENGSVESDFATLLYTMDGHRLWAQPWGAGNGQDDKPSAILVDRLGYVTAVGEGYVNIPDHHREMIAVQYDRNGAYQRFWSFHSQGKFTRAVAAGLDNSGNTFITGEVGGRYGIETATLKFDSRSEKSWENHFRGNGGCGGGTNPAAPKAIAVANNGHTVDEVTVCGVGAGVVDAFDGLYTLRYNLDGKLLWLGVCPGASLSENSPVLAMNGHFKAVAFQSQGARSRDITVIGYRDDPDSSKQVKLLPVHH